MRSFPSSALGVLLIAGLAWFATPATVLAHGADADDDGVANVLDNCIAVVNPANAVPTDCNGDGDSIDPGELVGEQCDRDQDDVGDACDNCVAMFNPRPGDPSFPVDAPPAESFQTLTGDQLDDDADGVGNACDGDMDQTLPIVGFPDLAQMRLAVGKLRSSNDCPQADGSPGGSCARFDMDGKLAIIGFPDLARLRAMIGQLNGPSCDDCPLLNSGFPDAPVCGNGEVEVGEECDDGNEVDDDGCDHQCTVPSGCEVEEFSSTFDAIQTVIFDNQGCSAGICHGTFGQGGLKLQAGQSYSNLVGVGSVNSGLKRVEPGEPVQSYLWEKLAAKTIPEEVTTTGAAMPNGGLPAIPRDHLDAIELWIRGGAPENLVVDGTAERLGTCLPEPDPLVIPVPDPPAADVGVQLRQTPWPLPSQSEDEICMATYYDFSDRVSASNQVDCPEGLQTPNNPSGKCFYYHKQVLRQDPQSHHSIIHLYTGNTLVPESNPAPRRQFGPWTYKFQDTTNPLQGEPCDPLDVDAIGFHENCSGAVRSSLACLDYGPADFSTGGFMGGGNTAPTFSGSQEPFYDQEFADGVYSLLPLAGVVVWNSHAFNLTQGNTSMSQYLDLEFAQPADRQYPVQGIFDAQEIFVQNVPPFEKREYCSSYTAPENAHVFQLSSHTHRHGVRWRTWEPPNTPCSSGQPDCVPGPPEQLIYQSFEYTDPVQLILETPIVLDSTDAADRTFLFCSEYDNGFGVGSPAVKRQSTSPEPPLLFGLPVGPGGPCNNNELACLAGPHKGVSCGGNDSVCDSSPGAGDGECDACPVKGGVTTEDEMFILLGNFYIP